MRRLVVLAIALVLMLVSLPLASWGSASDITGLMIAALALFGVASLTPPVMHFVPSGTDEEESG